MFWITTRWTVKLGVRSGVASGRPAENRGPMRGWITRRLHRPTPSGRKWKVESAAQSEGSIPDAVWARLRRAQSDRSTFRAAEQSVGRRVARRWSLAPDAGTDWACVSKFSNATGNGRGLQPRAQGVQLGILEPVAPGCRTGTRRW